MPSISITWKEVTTAGLVFALIVVGFALLAAVFKWPNEQSGWPLAIIIAVVIAGLPLFGRVVSFVQQQGASIEALGVKIDFSGFTKAAEAQATALPANIVQGDVPIPGSNPTELERFAEESKGRTVATIDLKEGRAWYLTRVFAVAATADFLGAPRLIVLIGQRAGKPSQVGGWIRPGDAVRGLTEHDPGYEKLWDQVRKYLDHLRAHAPNTPGMKDYTPVYQRISDTAVMPILVDQMRNPGSFAGESSPPAIEPADKPPWVTLAQIEGLLDPWLVRDSVDVNKPTKDQVEDVLAAPGEFAVAVRDGEFAGIIEVQRAERYVLRQLATRAAA